MAQFDISVGEILDSLGSFERRELYDELAEEFYEHNGPQLEGSNLTSTESDFQQVLLNLWERRLSLTPGQINRITDILTEPSIQ